MTNANNNSMINTTSESFQLLLCQRQISPTCNYALLGYMYRLYIDPIALYYHTFTFSKQAFSEPLDFFLRPFIASWKTYIWLTAAKLTLPVQYASNIEFISQKWHWCRCWQRATPESYVQINPLVFSIGCPCSHWLFRFSVLHAKNVKTITH